MVSHSSGITDYIRLLYKATIYHLFIDNHSGGLFRFKILFLPDLIKQTADSVTAALQDIFTLLTQTATVFLSQLDCMMSYTLQSSHLTYSHSVSCQVK